MTKYLNAAEEINEEQRTIYLKSMFLCVNPLSLIPLAIAMYQKYEEICPTELKQLFSYNDSKKVQYIFELEYI